MNREAEEIMDLAEREQRVFALLGELKRKAKYLQWLLIRNRQRLFLLKVDEITWIEAQGNYVRVHHRRGSDLLRETIGALESELNPTSFLRIHRSAIVQINVIKELHPTPHGEYRVVMEDGTQLVLTRKYRPNLQEVIGKVL